MTAPRPKLVAREDGIGSSEIATILGLNPYQSAYRLWCEKKGLLPGFSGNRFSEWGKRLEDPIARAWSDETGLRLLPIPTQHLFGHPWAYASVDRVQPATEQIVEIKTANDRQAPRWGFGSEVIVPEEYLVQWQWQSLVLRGLAAVLGDSIGKRYTEGEIAVLIGGSDFRRYAMRADDDLQRQLWKAAVDWWSRYLVGDEEPEVDDSTDTADALKSRFPQNEEAELFLADEDQEDSALALREARSLLGETEKLVRFHESQIKRALGSKPGMCGPWGRITWKTDKLGRRIFRPTFEKQEH